jgi:hypothetical protein
MWLKLFMDDYHLNNIAKVKNQQKLGQIIIWGKQKLAIFHNENNFVKNIMQTLLNPY